MPLRIVGTNGGTAIYNMLENFDIVTGLSSAFSTVMGILSWILPMLKDYFESLECDFDTILGLQCNDLDSK